MAAMKKPVTKKGGKTKIKAGKTKTKSMKVYVRNIFGNTKCLFKNILQ